MSWLCYKIKKQTLKNDHKSWHLFFPFFLSFFSIFLAKGTAFVFFKFLGNVSNLPLEHFTEWALVPNLVKETVLQVVQNSIMFYSNPTPFQIHLAKQMLGLCNGHIHIVCFFLINLSTCYIHNSNIIHWCVYYYQRKQLIELLGSYNL